MSKTIKGPDNHLEFKIAFRGIFLESRVTWHPVVCDNKVKNIIVNQRPELLFWICSSSEKVATLPWLTFIAILVILSCINSGEHVIMSLPISRQDGHPGFWIIPNRNNISWESLEKYCWQVLWIHLQWKKNCLGKQGCKGGHLGFRIATKYNKISTELLVERFW